MIDFEAMGQQALSDPWGKGVANDVEKAVIAALQDAYRQGQIAAYRDAATFNGRYCEPSQKMLDKAVALEVEK